MHDHAQSSPGGIADDGAPGRRGRRWLTLVTLCMAVLIAQVDTSVVNLAVRPIGAYFAADVGALQWVLDGYNLTYTVFLLSGGLLADLYGRRRMFGCGVAIFVTASLLCAFAPSIPFLIGGRAVAGFGAALLLPASLAIIRVVWPNSQERGRALGLWAACNGLAFVIGPTLGGLLIARFGWRSIFLVVVPLGLAALALAMISIPESSDARNRRFDGAAQLVGGLALGALAVAAIESHGRSAAALVAGGIAALAFIAFVRIEGRGGAGALVPLDIFRVGDFRRAMVATAGMTFGMYGALFLLPLLWQDSGRLDPAAAGQALLPMAVVFAVISPLSGLLAERLGTRLMAGGGVVVIGCALLLIGVTADAASLWPAEVGLALTGVGMGLATGPLTGAAVGAVGAARSGTAGSLVNVARMAGATLGVAILGTIFALAHGGPAGLRLAMLLGGGAQIASAVPFLARLPPFRRSPREI